MINKQSRLLIICLEIIVCSAIGVAVWFHSDSSLVVDEPAITLNYSFGISMGDVLPGLSQEELEKRLDDLVSLRVGWIRMDMGWDEIQREDRETYDWSRIDRVVRAAKARHIKILPILAYTPAWARRVGCNTSKCAPFDVSDFAEFVTVAVERYSSQGIHVWEIWNEPNLTSFWKPYPSVKNYAALLRASHTAIRTIDPTATIITGGLGPTQTGSEGIAPIDFLSSLYDEGASNTFDAVGFHPYSYPAYPSQYTEGNAWTQLASTSPSLRSVMVANDDEGKQIWLTEYGVPTSGPGGMSEAAQAVMLTDSLTLWKHGTSFAGPFFWYSYKDLGTSQHTNENFFGILRYDGSKKPVYESMKTLLLDTGTK